MTHDACATRATQIEPVRSRARWRSAAFDAAREAMLILDEDGACVDANAAARELLGVGSAEVIGRRVDEFLDPSAPADHRRRWAFFLVDGHDEGLWELSREDRSRVCVQYSLIARIAPNRHLAILRDPDAHRVGGPPPGTTAEAPAAALVPDIHDRLRTHLSGLVAATDRLDATRCSDEQRRCVEMLRASGDALSALIGEIARAQAPASPGSLRAVPPARSERQRTRERQPPASPGRRVLLVDDDARSRLMSLRLMRERGLDVHAAQGGREALEALEQGSYDAIFMDCEMPGLDGYETTREIRRREGPGRHTPVIAMTAGASTADAERCRAAGMDFYVAKPLRTPGLDYVVAQAISTVEG